MPRWAPAPGTAGRSAATTGSPAAPALLPATLVRARTRRRLLSRTRRHRTGLPAGWLYPELLRAKLLRIELLRARLLRTKPPPARLLRTGLLRTGLLRTGLLPSRLLPTELLRAGLVRAG